MRQDENQQIFRQGDAAVSRIPLRTFAGRFEPEGAQTLLFRSDWGREMTPVWQMAAGTDIAVTAGRCGKGYAPWIFIREKSGLWRFLAVAWPGNWHVELTPAGEVRVSADPGAEAEVLWAHGPDFHSLRRAVCLHLRETLPPTRRDPSVVSWNHWWRYEDQEITEELVLQNARTAREIGLDLIVLDAGWFGEDGHWTRQRGDWHKVNLRRFPHGLKWLAEQIHALGLKFGLWLEPEGMGEESELRRMHPQWEARCPGLAQPYLCLGAEGAAAWLREQIAALVEETRADYLKLDFNVDPLSGCCRRDHGHPPQEGLSAHMQAYLSLLDDLRRKYPDLVIENCSSGGLRLDLSMLEHTDVSFLSDPDETDHSLQCFLWLSFLPPERLLHWGWSDTRVYPDGSRVFLPCPQPRLTKELSAAMLHPFGFSRDLTALTEAERMQLREMIGRWREHVAPLIPRGVIRLLTPPPLRAARTDDGRGVSFPGTGCACMLEAERGFALLLQGECEIPFPDTDKLLRLRDGMMLSRAETLCQTDGADIYIPFKEDMT